MVSQALKRPGRIDSIVYVPLPDEDTRREILQIKFKTMPIQMDVSLEWLVAETAGYSGAEVSTSYCFILISHIFTSINFFIIHSQYYLFLDVYALKINFLFLTFLSTN